MASSPIGCSTALGSQVHGSEPPTSLLPLSSLQNVATPCFSTHQSLSEVPLSEQLELLDDRQVPFAGMPRSNTSHCSGFAPMELAFARTVKGEQDFASPPSSFLALRPRSFKLEEEDRAKKPRLLDFDGMPAVLENSSCSWEGSPCEVSAVSPLAKKSFPSSFRSSVSGDTSEQTMEEGDFLPGTPPDRMFSYLHVLPPTPMAPKKSHTLRSAPLRKTQPRRLQFGDKEGDDVPEVSSSPVTLNSSQILGVGLISPRILDPSYEDDGCRGSVRSDDNGADSGLPVASSPRTPPDKLFNSFAPGGIPPASRCLTKSLGVSKLQRDWR